MSIYLARIDHLTKTHVSTVGYLKQGRLVARKGAQPFSSPSAAVRAKDAYIGSLSKSTRQKIIGDVERAKPIVTFRVFVGYRDFIDMDLDDRIERAAGKGADGMGFGLFKGGGRDIDFSFKKRGAALAAAARVRRLSYGGGRKPLKVSARVVRDEDFSAW